MKNEIVLIVCWFGPLRPDFYFWLKSVEYNPTIDFLFFTDQDIVNTPVNFKVVKCNLVDIEKIAKEKVWNGCIISKPYKLCDYKPAYGDMFHDYIKNYEFWGHCDTDLIFGDIRSYCEKKHFNNYERFGLNGPFTLYRNNSKTNSIYMDLPNIKNIYTVQKPFGFDEWGLNYNGTSPYWLKNYPQKTFNRMQIENLEPYHYSFKSIVVEHENLNIKNIFYSFDKGKLYRIGTKKNEIVKEEVFLVHLQKRPIKVKTKLSGMFMIIPPGDFIDYIDYIDKKFIRWNIRDGAFWAYYTRFRNKINKCFGLQEWQNTVLTPSQGGFNK